MKAAVLVLVTKYWSTRGYIVARVTPVHMVHVICVLNLSRGRLDSVTKGGEFSHGWLNSFC